MYTACIYESCISHLHLISHCSQLFHSYLSPKQYRKAIVVVQSICALSSNCLISSTACITTNFALQHIFLLTLDALRLPTFSNDRLPTFGLRSHLRRQGVLVLRYLNFCGKRSLLALRQSFSNKVQRPSRLVMEAHRHLKVLHHIPPHSAR